MNIFKKNINAISPTKWSGGETRQLFIFPENLTVKDDFQLRISVATLFKGESSFTKYSNYSRILTLLEGRVKLFHQEQEPVLAPLDNFYFSGDTFINSLVEIPSLDFNIIYNDNYFNVNFFLNSLTESYEFFSSFIFIFSLEDGVKITTNSMSIFLKKYDFIIMDRRSNEVLSSDIQCTNLESSGKCLISNF